MGFNGTLPWQTYASTNVYYGSGSPMLFGTPQAQYPGIYLPSHTTFDLSIGKTFAEKYTFSVNSVNVANRRVQLDNSLPSADFTGMIHGKSMASSGTGLTIRSRSSVRYRVRVPAGWRSARLPFERFCRVAPRCLRLWLRPG